MQFQKTPLADAFSAAYAAHPIHAAELQKLEAAANTFVSEIDESKEEEYIKNQTATFLRNSLYPDAAYHINIDKRKDLVIRTGKSQKDPIAVILEFKSLKSPDMVTQNNLNTKALQELVWYYMQERSDNLFIKHLVVVRRCHPQHNCHTVVVGLFSPAGRSRGVSLTIYLSPAVSLRAYCRRQLLSLVKLLLKKYLQAAFCITFAFRNI